MDSSIFVNSDFEITTYSVEKILIPIKKCIKTLTDQKMSRLKKGNSKDTEQLRNALIESINVFIKIGKEIALNYTQVEHDIVCILQEIETSGKRLSDASVSFSLNPFSTTDRSEMYTSANDVVTSITRLLIVGDFVDVHLLLNSLKTVENALDSLQAAVNENEVEVRYKALQVGLEKLKPHTTQRAKDLKDGKARNEISAANATLFTTYPMLFTSIKTCVNHPEISAARENRQLTYLETKEAINTIGQVARGVKYVGDWLKRHEIFHCGVSSAIEDFNMQLLRDVGDRIGEQLWVNSMKTKSQKIVHDVKRLNQFICNETDRVEYVIERCDNVKKDVNFFFDTYTLKFTQNKDDFSLEMKNDALNIIGTIDNYVLEMKKIAIDYISEYFYEIDAPLLVLRDCATNRDLNGVISSGEKLKVHTTRLVNIGEMLCTLLTENEENGIKNQQTLNTTIQICEIGRICKRLENLVPQTINSALVYAEKPTSKIAQVNMTSFIDTNKNLYNQYSNSLQYIVEIDDFMFINENFILNDVNNCVYEIKKGKIKSFEKFANCASTRCKKICNFVEKYLKRNSFDPIYSAKIEATERTIFKYKNEIFKQFDKKVDFCKELLSENGRLSVDEENSFIDISRVLYDGVHNIRRLILEMNGVEFTESDVATEESKNSVEGLQSDLYQDFTKSVGGSEMIMNLGDYAEPTWVLQANEEEKKRWQVEAKDFNVEKRKFEKEVNKWDDSANDIIRMAKHMCIILMDMSDFTRGRGPLGTITGFIDAAREISDTGKELNILCQSVANMCPDSVTKTDLTFYLQRIELYCHQLHITSRVKADVQNIDSDVVLSGLDSATSLLQSSKNLINSVIMAVRCSYVASTKYCRLYGNEGPVVMWKMKPPEKKPLIRKDSNECKNTKISMGAPKKRIEAIRALDEFRMPE